MLPLEVQQAMGLQPQFDLPVPADDGSAALPQPDQYGGLHPPVASALGLAPPPPPQKKQPPRERAGLPPLAQQVPPPLPSFAAPQPEAPPAPVLPNKTAAMP